MLPAKVFSYMACGLPVIVAMEGEVAELLAEAGAGWAVSPEDPEALAGAIDRLRGAPGIAEDLGRSGREFVCAGFSRQELARRLAATLERAVGSLRP
jgi:glycosyltransferase involved in cell wall biosynthesis